MIETVDDLLRRGLENINKYSDSPKIQVKMKKAISDCLNVNRKWFTFNECSYTLELWKIKTTMYPTTIPMVTSG